MLILYLNHLYFPFTKKTIEGKQTKKIKEKEEISVFTLLSSCITYLDSKEGVTEKIAKRNFYSRRSNIMHVLSLIKLSM